MILTVRSLIPQNGFSIQVQQILPKVKTAKEVDETNLKNWRADAKNEVKEYYEALDLSQYSKEAKATLNSYVSSARTAIDAATTKEAIDKIVKDFKANVDSVEKNVEDQQQEETSSSAEQTQSSGCFGVVGSACAVSGIGLAAAAIVALRKKKENDCTRH